jgi:hypothetical protein
MLDRRFRACAHILRGDDERDLAVGPAKLLANDANPLGFGRGFGGAHLLDRAEDDVPFEQGKPVHLGVRRLDIHDTQ